MFRTSHWGPATFVVVLCVCSACSRTNNSPVPTERPNNELNSTNSSISFVDIAAQCGLKFTYVNGEDASHATMLESLGGGLAIFDFDNDELLDIYCAGGGTFSPDEKVSGLSSGFFQHLSGLTFENRTGLANLGKSQRYTHGVAAADFNNDGFDDLLVTSYNGLALYCNLGDGTFEDVAVSANMTDRLWSSSAAWGDIDADGDLDLYVAHYVDWSFNNHPRCPGPYEGEREVCPPAKFSPLPDTLYESMGDGTFVDRSHDIGLRSDGKGLGVVIADIDLDCDVDIYVTNDGTANFLYRNDDGKELVEIGAMSGTALSDAGHPDGSMGVDLGDYDLDGLPDIWVTNFESESFAIYHNDGQNTFRHLSRFTGVTAVGSPFVGWGTVFADFDRDRDEDLFTSNGHVVLYPQNAPRRQVPLLLENDAGKRFQDIAKHAGEYTSSAHLGRGVATGDINGDGKLDLVVSHINSPVALLKNDSANDNACLSLKLIGVTSNRDALGSIAKVTANGKTQMRQAKGGSSYASTNDSSLFFGLGQCDHVDSVEIHWPAGATTRLSDIAPNQKLVIHEPAKN